MLSTFGLSAGRCTSTLHEQVVAVEGEVVRDEELAGERPVIRADADDVAGVEIAEEVPADVLDGGRLDVDEQAPVAGQVGPLDGGAELLLQLVQSFASDHGLGVRAGSTAAAVGRRRASGSSV